MKRALVIIGILLVGAIGTILYFWNMPHRDVSAEKAKYEVTADQLYQAFSEDQQKAGEKYLDQVVQVTGTISEKKKNAVVLDEQIYCKMDSTAKVPASGAGSSVVLKGRVMNYDDLFSQVRMDFCTVEGE